MSLKEETGKTSRTVAHQLRLLDQAGLVTMREDPNPRDRRSRLSYQIAPSWPWLDSHERVVRDVNRAIAKLAVIEPLTAGAKDSGRGGAGVYSLLVVESGNRSAAESYPTGAVNVKKVNRVLKAVRASLRGEDTNGYHWQYLLRQVITEIVTSQPRSYFLLSYPRTCFSYDGKGAPWPDPHWRESRPITPFSVPITPRQRRFLTLHDAYWSEALATVKRWPRVSAKVWEERIHGSDFHVPTSIHERTETPPPESASG